MRNIRIVDSTPQDVFGIRNVQRITWIDTYPNLELGITKEDVGFVKTGKSVHSKGVDPLPSGKIIPEIEMVKKSI